MFNMNGTMFWNISQYVIIMSILLGYVVCLVCFNHANFLSINKPKSFFELTSSSKSLSIITDCEIIFNLDEVEKCKCCYYN